MEKRNISQLLNEVADETLESRSLMESLGHSKLLHNLILEEEHRVLMPLILVLEKKRL